MMVAHPDSGICERCKLKSSGDKYTFHFGRHLSTEVFGWGGPGTLETIRSTYRILGTGAAFFCDRCAGRYLRLMLVGPFAYWFGLFAVVAVMAFSGVFVRLDDWWIKQVMDRESRIDHLVDERKLEFDRLLAVHQEQRTADVRAHPERYSSKALENGMRAGLRGAREALASKFGVGDEPLYPAGWGGFLVAIGYVVAMIPVVHCQERTKLVLPGVVPLLGGPVFALIMLHDAGTVTAADSTRVGVSAVVAFFLYLWAFRHICKQRRLILESWAWNRHRNTVKAEFGKKGIHGWNSAQFSELK